MKLTRFMLAVTLFVPHTSPIDRNQQGPIINPTLHYCFVENRRATNFTPSFKHLIFLAFGLYPGPDFSKPLLERPQAVSNFDLHVVSAMW